MLGVSYINAHDAPPGKCVMHLVWKTDFLGLLSMAFSTHSMISPIFFNQDALFFSTKEISYGHIYELGNYNFKK